MITGVQLWGILKDGNRDAMETLRTLRRLGYEGIEICVSLEEIPGLEHVIWPRERFLARAGEIRTMGLEVISCHIFADDIAAHLDALARFAEESGLRQFVVKSPRELTEASLARAAADYRAVGDALKAVGAELLLHNELDDSAAHVGDRTAFEYLLDLCQGRLGAQVDVGWAYAGGVDPVELLRRNAGRVRSLHVKDFVREGDRLVEVAPGTGVVDIAACLRFAGEHGCPAVIDMDSFLHDVEDDLAAALVTLDRAGE